MTITTENSMSHAAHSDADIDGALMGAATPHRIRIIAPSGYAESAERVTRAVARLRAAGHTVEDSAAGLRVCQRFSGTDAERLADLNGLNDEQRPASEIVLAMRGGYGATRLLAHIDYPAFRAQVRTNGELTPRVMVGFSDFTAVQMALLAQAGQITFAGPMLAGHFGGDQVSAFTMQHFWKMLHSTEYTIHGTLPGQAPLDVRGTFWGGNLAMLASLVGTPYMPQIEGGILFVEDIHEQPFRTERMLYQLYQAGILQRQKALVMGTFSESTATQYNNGFTLASVVAQIASVAKIPVIQGLPFGHQDDMVTLAIGAQGHLRSGASGFQLTMSGYPNFAAPA